MQYLLIEINSGEEQSMGLFTPDNMLLVTRSSKTHNFLSNVYNRLFFF